MSEKAARASDRIACKAMPQRVHEPNVVFQRNVFDCEARCTQKSSCDVLPVLDVQLLGPSGLPYIVHLKTMT